MTEVDPAASASAESVEETPPPPPLEEPRAEKSWGWLYALIGILVLVAVVASLFWPSDDSKKTLGSVSNTTNQQVQLTPGSNWTVPNAPTCDGIKKSVEYTSTPKKVNPDGRCAPGFWFEGHRIYVWQAGKTADSDKTLVCDPKLPDPEKKCRPMPVDIESVATADTPFTDYYWLLPYHPVQVFR
jgi:hypothetical protein